MSHRSRLGTLVIDCRSERDGAIDFWSAALGIGFRRDEDPRYAAGDTPPGQMRVILQQVDHDSRVHLDIETDDKEAEAARLATLGARLIERHPKGWIIMEAPTGHRLCLVDPEAGFDAVAKVWESRP